jgi:hypothetical protein
LTEPRARSEELVIEELNDELLVYDERNHRAHCLNATAARVWQACDGQMKPAALGTELGLDAEAVTRALSELTDCELLETGPRLQTSNGLTRRDLGFRAAKVGAAAASVPLIWSVAVPAAAGAITPTPEVCAQYNNKSCSTCALIAGCCCCCEGGGNCKFCAPVGLCTTFTNHCANPHCSTTGGTTPPGTPCSTLPAEAFTGGGCIECCGCNDLPGGANCQCPH